MQTLMNAYWMEEYVITAAITHSVVLSARVIPGSYWEMMEEVVLVRDFLIH